MTPLFEIQDIEVRRDGKTILAIDSLKVDGHTAILGPNGGGKSTLLKLLSKRIHPHGGHGIVKVDGKERASQEEVRRHLGIVAAELGEHLLADFTSEEVALSGLYGTLGVTAFREVSEADRDHARTALASCGVEHLAGRSFETLSAGEKRRILIARALVHKPKGLVLDEPTSPLDPGARRRFLCDLENLAGSTVIVLVTHHPEEIAPWINRLIYLERGRITFDGTREAGLCPSRLNSLFDLTR